MTNEQDVNVELEDAYKLWIRPGYTISARTRRRLGRSAARRNIKKVYVLLKNQEFDVSVVSDGSTPTEFCDACSGRGCDEYYDLCEECSGDYVQGPYIQLESLTGVSIDETRRLAAEALLKAGYRNFQSVVTYRHTGELPADHTPTEWSSVTIKFDYDTPVVPRTEKELNELSEERQRRLLSIRNGKQHGQEDWNR